VYLLSVTRPKKNTAAFIKQLLLYPVAQNLCAAGNCLL
jgi:hypothetical protein